LESESLFSRLKEDKKSKQNSLFSSSLNHSPDLPQREFTFEVDPKVESSLYLRSSEFFSNLGDDEWDMVQQPKAPAPSEEGDLQHWISANQLDSPARRGSFRG